MIQRNTSLISRIASAFIPAQTCYVHVVTPNFTGEVQISFHVLPEKPEGDVLAAMGENDLLKIKCWWQTLHSDCNCLVRVIYCPIDAGLHKIYKLQRVSGNAVQVQKLP